MAYTKTNWVNGTTPLNDKNMNKIENELENLDTNISKSTDEYSSTSTYSIGELVIYNNKLYKANQDITTAEAFNSSHWTEVTLLSDVNEIKSVVNNNADNLNKLNEVLDNKVDKAEMKKEEIAITDIAGLDYSRFKLIKIGNTITANGWITTTKEVSSSSDLFKIPYSNPYANPSRLIVLNADGTFKGSIEYGSKKNIFNTRDDLVKNNSYLVIGTIII